MKEEKAVIVFLKVNITFIGPGTDKVCAWAENPFGTNLSDPYT